MSDVASNANVTNRKPGGITGKGFQPGKSGNPAGWTRRRRQAKAVGELIRDYLAQTDDEATTAAGRNVTRLDALIQRLAQEDPKTLLAYAYGKPSETHEAQAAEATAMEFVVRVNGTDIP